MKKTTTIYSIYNNKGGVGKTTLCQNLASLYAENNPEKQVLVIDLCPQSNISHFLLGGGHAGYDQHQKLQTTSSRKNIAGFVDWLLQSNSGFTNKPKAKYSIKVSQYNEYIKETGQSEVLALDN
jgi:chromosome partitioning protein